MGAFVLAVAWWAPLAIIGGALAGLAVGYLLLAAAGGPRTRSGTGSLAYERTDKTNYPTFNVAALIVFLGIVGLIIGLAVGLSAD